MTQSVKIPTSGWYVLGNARVHASQVSSVSAPADRDGFTLVDIAIADGKVTGLAPRNGRPEPPRTVDLGGRIVMPCFVDCHTHIDKGHIWPRMPNPDGSFMGALDAAGTDRLLRWNRDDVIRRMDFSLRCAYAHGTKVLRTHLDSVAPQETISWPAFEEMRARWAGRIDLHAASLVGIEDVRNASWFAALAARVAEARGALGAVTYMVPDLDALLDRVFGLASDHGLDVDFHADETDDIASVSLRHIAEAAMRNRFEGKILVGHCCALARQPDREVKHTLDLAARAGLAVVSLPMCNMYLQDRRQDGTTPRWRGVTLVHEMKARGIPVAVASDNTRDPFYAYGDLDMLEVYRQATRTLHLDHPVDDWPRAVGITPARALRVADAGVIAADMPADLVVFKGRSWTELLSRPETDRIVIRDGRAIDTRVPDYAELDVLMEAP
jgi:cytosine deaminase